MASGDSLFVLDSLSNRPPAVGYASVDLRNEFMVLDFDDATNEQAQFHAVVPSHYSGGNLLAFLTWTSTTATTGNAKLRVEATRMPAGTNLDTLPVVGGSSEVTAAAPTVSGELVVSPLPSISLSGLSAGDLLLISFTRLAMDATDTLSGDIEMVVLEIREA